MTESAPADRAASDPRRDRACAWACASLGLDTADFVPASVDASFRRYFRLSARGRSWIVMDAPPEHEDCGPFVAIARLLRGWGLNAPEIHAQDMEQGFLLLSDLGTRTYLDVLTPDNADELLGHAVAALVRMQVAALRRPEALRGIPPYDAALLTREIRLFPEWYLPRHLGVTLDEREAAAFETITRDLVDAALAQPRTFVHRDYMPRNLMVSEPPPGILDFQDAVVGPFSYDIVCLFRDAFLSWPEQRVERWLRDYWEQARRNGLPLPERFDEFRRQTDWMGVQRHLKVIGIFARLTYRDGKPRYVADTPRFVRYVMEVAPRYPELAPLVQLFERHVLPRVGS